MDKCYDSQLQSKKRFQFYSLFFPLHVFLSLTLSDVVMIQRDGPCQDAPFIIVSASRYMRSKISSLNKSSTQPVILCYGSREHTKTRRWVLMIFMAKWKEQKKCWDPEWTWKFYWKWKIFYLILVWKWEIS